MARLVFSPTLPNAPPKNTKNKNKKTNKQKQTNLPTVTPRSTFAEPVVAGQQQVQIVAKDAQKLKKVTLVSTFCEVVCVLCHSSLISCVPRSMTSEREYQ